MVTALEIEVKYKMKKLNITKERFEKSRYFQKKYGKLEYVSESGNLYKTDKGKVLKFSKESSISDYDTQDYGDENYGDPDEFDVKARELGEEWDELGTKTKNEYCESLWYVIGNWIATNRLDEKTAEAILWEAVMSSQDRTDVYDVIMKMVENGKNSTLARKKK